MKTPVRDLRSRYISSAYLREMIPKGSVAETFLFYSGQIEFALSDHKRFVHSHTLNYPVYEFWAYLAKDSRRVYDILVSEKFKFEHKEMYDILQEKWPTYPNPYVRAALFFMLNRCSAEGLPSRGKLDTEHYTPAALNLLRTYRAPENFFLEHHAGKKLEEVVSADGPADFLVFPLMNYDYNLFDEGHTLGHEETYIHHGRLHKKLQTIDKKWIVIYNYHKEAVKLYGDYTQTMINKYGRPTQSLEHCEELIIANF